MTRKPLIVRGRVPLSETNRHTLRAFGESATKEFGNDRAA